MTATDTLSKPIVAFALAFVVACAAGVPAYAQSTGTISGTLTDEQTGLPLTSGPPGSASPRFTVYVCPLRVPNCGSATPGAVWASPDANGHYVVPDITPGFYAVKADGAPTHVTELHPDVPCISNDCTAAPMSPIDVTAGSTTTIDFALTRGGSIAGTVRDAGNGAGVGRIVNIFNARTSPAGQTFTDLDGHYTFPTLPPGQYYLRTEHIRTSLFTDTDPFLDVLYPDVACDTAYVLCPLPRGTLVTVTTGSTTIADLSLPRAGSISGRLTAADTGAPISSPAIPAVTILGADQPQSVSVAPDGTYTAIGVRPGRYYVRGEALAGGSPTRPPYYATMYGNACDGCAGTPTVVEVSSGGAVSGIDIALVPLPAALGSITGRIVAAPEPSTLPGPFEAAGCAEVQAFDMDGRLVTSAVPFNASPTPSRWPSTYTIRDLPAGTYYVRFANPACFRSGFHIVTTGGASPDQTYGATPCITDDCDVRRGTPVVVTAGGTTSGVDFFVETTGSVLTDPDAILYDVRGVRVSDSRQILTGIQGTVFKLYMGLTDGAYYARTPDGRMHGRTTCADCPATAGRPLIVRRPERVATDFESPSRYSLGGIVRDAATGTPLSTVTVELYNAAGSFLTSALSNAAGSYTFNDPFDGSQGTFEPGRYFLRTSNSRGYVDRRQSDLPCGGCDPASGTPVTIVNVPRADINFGLTPGGTILLKTTDPGGVARTGQTVAFFDATGQKVARETVDAWGRVNVEVEPGTYYARSEPASGTVMTTYGAGACARGACNPADGTPVAVTAGGFVNLEIPIAACSPGDISPSILASAVRGRAFRQVLRASTPNTDLHVSAGGLPAGLTLDSVSGVLAGTPDESGVFTFSLAAIDASGCAFVRRYTLQVAQCSFTLSPDGATVGANGGPVTVTASDVCGYSTVASQVPWITADASTATVTSPLTLTVQQNTDAAARIGTVTVGRRLFTVRQAGQASSAPFGNFELPAPNAQVSGSVAVTGWALDDVEVVRVRIMREPVAGEAPGALVFIGNAVIVAGARPDVERAYPDLPRNDRAGWGYLLLTNMLPGQGNGTFVLHAIVDDAEGHAVDLGARTIVGANMSAIAPFGAIDTPSQGETIAGTAYRNWGWALTPQPKVIPTDGSTIQVLIDGVPIGSPVYNLFRPDVASLFPGLRNSGGPVGYRDLDTTALGEGVHTIAWIVTDSQAAGAGIGSRYFTVRNSADAQPAGLFQGPQTGQYAESLLAPSGSRTQRLSPLQRVHVRFGEDRADECRASYSAYLVANGEVRDLPAGAAILASGEFTWQPGPAFHGTYEFAVVGTDCRGAVTRESMTIHIW